MLMDRLPQPSPELLQQKEAARLATLHSVSHQTDLRLRRIINERVTALKSAQQPGQQSSRSVQELAKDLNAKRKAFLEDLRHKAVGMLIDIDGDAEGPTSDTTDESALLSKLENLFVNYYINN